MHAKRDGLLAQDAAAAAAENRVGVGVPRGTMIRVGSGSQAFAVAAAAHDATTTAAEDAPVGGRGHRLLQQPRRMLQQSVTPKAAQDVATCNRQSKVAKDPGQCKYYLRYGTNTREI